VTTNGAEVPTRSGSWQLDAGKLLLVEGTHDELFFEAFLRHLQEDHNVAMREARVFSERDGGKSTMPTFISRGLWTLPWLREGKPLSLAVIRDADESVFDGEGRRLDRSAKPENAFKSIKDALDRGGFPAPEAPATFAKDSSRRLSAGVFILPDNEHSGSLETLCRRALEDRPEVPCVQALFRCAEETAKLVPGTPDKAFVQAWLALQQEADLHLGKAAQKRLLDFRSHVFDQLREFLTMWLTTTL
jgi:hypothetical protein